MASNKLPSLTDIEKTEQELTAKLEALKAQRAEVENKRNDEIKEMIEGLPKKLGVLNLDGVTSLIRQVQKGTLGKAATGVRSYVRLSDEQKAEITEKLKSGVQVSTLANQYGVSGQTVFKLKEAAGLVQKRETATATA